jgi:putative cell wall-binding protein
LRTHHVTRLSGSDRYATAAKVAQASHPGTAETVFIATGANFPDALAGSAIAGRLGAPLLLVTPDSIPAATTTELERLDPSTIVIVGGEGAVSSQVETALGTHGTTVRLAGANRYETAVAISQYGFPRRNSADEVVITSGLGFADALSGGPAAAFLGGPLLLTEALQLPDAIRDEIIRLGPSRIVVLGGTAAVSDAVLGELSELAPTIRIAGSDRYQTAVLVSQEVFADGAAAVYLSTGVEFPDGLTGGAAAGNAGVPILLTMPSSLPAVVAAEVTRLGTYEVYLLGGESAIAAGVASVLETLGM